MAAVPAENIARSQCQALVGNGPPRDDDNGQAAEALILHIRNAGLRSGQPAARKEARLAKTIPFCGRLLPVVIPSEADRRFSASLVAISRLLWPPTASKADWQLPTRTRHSS